MPGLSNFKIEKDIKRQLCCGIQLGEVQIRFAFQMHNTFDVDVEDRLEICQKSYTTGFLCQKFYTLKMHKSGLILPKIKQLNFNINDWLKWKYQISTPEIEKGVQTYQING